MDARQADLLREIAPAVLGRRLRAARRAKGLTQTDLAGPGLSVGYVSRIESGQRRPTGKVLSQLADRLEIPLEQVLGGVAPREVDEIRLMLDYAELSLESGEPLEAERLTKDALKRSSSAGNLTDMVERASLLHARALEAQGHTDDAILELEALVDGGAGGLTRIKAGIALSRAYRDSGDLGRAIDAGERILATLEETGLAASDEAIQLTVTVAAAYFYRGDAGHAVRICRTAIKKAETLGSAKARAAAYWNASSMQAERGQVREAIPLAERALALLGEGQATRNLSRLRAELGRMQLELDPPEYQAARANLEQAAQELAWSSASPAEVATAELYLARAHYLDGDLETTQEITSRVHESVRDQAPLVAAEAQALAGQALAAAGDATGAVAAYQRAVHLLTGIGADRGAAQLWYDLACLLEASGLEEAARNAYRSAAAATGLRVRTGTPARSVLPSV